MTSVLMWPPSTGMDDPISYEGRTYSAIPGVPISVPSFDVPILEANGWRQFSLVPGSSTESMMNPGGKPSTLTVSGRQYTCAPGSSITVPKIDRNALEANGWVRVKNVSFTNSVNAITVPAGALAVFSVIRTTGWNGFCLQVRRSVDNATLDIGFVGNVVDWATADAFAVGSTLEVSIWYDQSGNGYNYIGSATPGQAPLFVRESHWKGIRPLTGMNKTLASPARYMHVDLTAATPNQNSLTIYEINAPRTNYENQMYWLTSVTVGSSAMLNAADTQGGNTGVRWNRVGSGANSSLSTSARLQSMAQAPLVGDIDGQQTTLTAPSSNTTAPIVNIFSDPGQETYNFLGDKFFQAIYPTADSAGTVTTRRSGFLTAFSPNTYTRFVCYGGNSLQVADRSTKARSLAWLVGFGRDSSDDASTPSGLLPALSQWDVKNFGVSGRTLATEMSDFAANKMGTNVIPAGVTRPIYVTGSNTNDIGNSGGYASTAAAQAAMDTQYTAFLTHVATVKTAGFAAVVVVTTIPRASFNLGSGNFEEDARVYWNTKLKNGAVANGYVVSDWCAVYPFNGASSSVAALEGTYYYTDGVHPLDSGYALIAPIDRAAILAA